MMVLMTAIVAALITGCTSGNAEVGALAWEADNTYGEAPVVVRLRVDRLRITTAQIVRVEVEVDAPEGVAMRLPELDQFTGSGFQVEFRTEPPTLLDDGRTRRLRRYRLEPFLAGDYPIPEMAIDWLAPGGEPASLSTRALTVQVRSVLTDPAAAGGTGTEGGLPELREVGDPVPAPLRWGRLVLAGVIALVVAGVVVVVIFWRRRAKARRPGPIEAPAVVALRELDKLERDGAPIEEMDRFYVKVSSILRSYLEAQFGLRAPEQTTEEFLAAVEGGTSFDREQQRTLRAFLVSCDAVKFARVRPSLDDTKGITATARRFVHATANSAEVSAASLGLAFAEDGR